MPVQVGVAKIRQPMKTGDRFTDLFFASLAWNDHGEVPHELADVRHHGPYHEQGEHDGRDEKADGDDPR